GPHRAIDSPEHSRKVEQKYRSGTPALFNSVELGRLEIDPIEFRLKIRKSNLFAKISPIQAIQPSY
ncbi:MAG: hypothetical protein V3T99_06720, partial [Nitrososphaerales archaeon]